MNLTIANYCQIKDNTLSINGKSVFVHSESETAQDFLTYIYREAKVNYPKFFKMDNLSRTGFLAAELLLRQTSIYEVDLKLKTGIFFSNRASSLETDEAYQKTIGEEYFPSPSLFVYTLPNIVMGEIAIKHKLFGENTFLVSETFDCQLIYDYVNQCFEETDMQNAIVGWVDFYQQKGDAFLMFVEKQKEYSESIFTVEEITKLYKS